MQIIHSFVLVINFTIPWKSKNVTWDRIKLDKFENENWDFTNLMNYHSGLQSVHRSGVIMLKPFNKIHCTKYDRSAHFQKFVITEHWMENIDFLLNTMEKYRPAHKNCCDNYFKLKLWGLVQVNYILYL